MRIDWSGRHAISNRIFFHPNKFFFGPIRAFHPLLAACVKTAQRA